MPRNLIILADGTGQQGGLSPDERQSNIYKIYRGAGPHSGIDPDEQSAFYDAGIGTSAGGRPSIAHRVWNGFCGATGLGLTRNVIDCYQHIITRWRPGDRVFLFGFSRGAYTVRCVATVMRLCGVPTITEDGTPLAANPKVARSIAEVAVKQVYQYALSSRDKPYGQTRDELAARFRERYCSGDTNGANAHPHFIGVFDTVAALGARELLAYVVIILLVALAGIAALVGIDTFQKTFALAVFLVGSATYLFTHIKYGPGLSDKPWSKRIRILPPRFVYYDESLGYKVGTARHALSTDENRNSFERVRWGEINRAGQLVQIWFAGNHSDIGGSYPEGESRLSDIALRWMVDEAKKAGIHWNDSAVPIDPDPAGIEHDECKHEFFRFAKRSQRLLTKNAPLHPTVHERLKLLEVRKSDAIGPYRPHGLREHEACRHYYKADELLQTHGAAVLAEAERLLKESDALAVENRKYWDDVTTEIKRRLARD